MLIENSSQIEFSHINLILMVQNSIQSEAEAKPPGSNPNRPVYHNEGFL